MILEPYKPIDAKEFVFQFNNFKSRYGILNVNYTEIPESFINSYNSLMVQMEKEDISSQSSENPVINAYYFLGKRVRLHQAYLMERFIYHLKKGHLRIAMCLARQLGKSIDLGLLLEWICWYNKMPVTISNITISYVTSRDDETAVEFLEKLRLILYDGDKHMEKFSDTPNFFTGSLKEPNNTHQITFLNNCFIKSIPPTMKGL